MRFLRVVDPAGAHSVVPPHIYDVNRANRILIVTEEEFDSINTSGVVGDELEELFIELGASTGRANLTGIYECADVAVAVPTIADAEIDEVAVDVSSAFSVSVPVGAAVIAIPQEALPTSAILCGAYVSATDTITVSFAAKEGGAGVTGANKNFTFLVFTLGTPAAD